MAKSVEIEARIRRIERQMNDARLGVEQELRQALLDMDSAAEEVTVAASRAGSGAEGTRSGATALQRGRDQQRRGHHRAGCTLARATEFDCGADASCRCADFAGARAGQYGSVVCGISWKPLSGREGKEQDYEAIHHSHSAGGGHRRGIFYYYHTSHTAKAPANTLLLSGNVEAHESVVGFRTQGRIVALPVEEGKQVKAGDLLARLDDADYQQQVRIDEAVLQTRGRELELALAGNRPQDIQAAEQTVADAKADLELKRADLARYSKLYKRDAISAQNSRPGGHGLQARAGDLRTGAAESLLRSAKAPAKSRLPSAAPPCARPSRTWNYPRCAAITPCCTRR